MCAGGGEWMMSVLKGVGAVDPFVAKLLAIADRTYKPSATSGAASATGPAYDDLVLALTRNDFMLHRGKDGKVVPVQVEMNMISASFSNLGPRAFELHRYLRHVAGADDVDAPEYTTACLDPATMVPAAMADAVRAYEEAAPEGVTTTGAVVLMVVQEGERNTLDQRPFEWRLWRDHGIRVLRRTMAECAVPLAEGAARGNRRPGALVVDGHEVALVYFRAGYTPTDYPTDLQWDVRYQLDRSAAICCPNVMNQLSGLKAVQAAFSLDPTVLPRFLPGDPTAVTAMQRTFATFHALGTPDDGPIIDAALEDKCASWVLKPCREGGGNNLYKAEAVAALLRLRSSPDRAQYILMSRIVPPAHKADILRDGVIHRGVECVSELGLYGATLSKGKDGEVVFVRTTGALLRTKLEMVDDGGVAAGVAVLDSIRLTEEEELGKRKRK